MSNKEMMIHALETAEDENKKILFEYSSEDGFSFMGCMVPEIMVRGNELEIHDMEKGVESWFSILINDVVQYYENENKYCIKLEHGEITFSPRC